MIIPSIDIMNGHAVQLIGGREQALDAGDPMPLLERFAVAGEVAVIDLDAALGRGDNRDLIRRMLRRAPCRVGGGIRDADTALAWLRDGAARVILGTAATPEVLSRLPRERVLAALDAEHGEVVTHGWRTRTGARIEERMQALSPHVGGFLVTLVEREGRLAGSDLERAGVLAGAAGDRRLTLAGGITTAAEVAALDRLGADAQVGMAIYTGRMDLADALAAPLVSDRADGLWPTVLVDVHGTALGLAWSSRDSLRQAVATRTGVYQSRRRGLWRKGETSGAVQDLVRVDADCDRDALRFTVRQHGAGFCHDGRWSCWDDGGGMPRLARLLADRVRSAPAGSYTRRLLDDPGLVKAKLLEEAGELAAARGEDDIAWETADVLYFALVAMARGGVSLDAVERELDRRSLLPPRKETS